MNTKTQILKAFDPKFKTTEEIELENLPTEKDIDKMSEEELNKLINELWFNQEIL